LPEKFFAIIFPENFYDLLFAGYLAFKGKRVAVIGNKALLNSFAKFLLLNPYRSLLVCDHLGLSLKPEKNFYLPDFQIITSQQRLDFFYDRLRRDFALERELGEEGKNFSGFLDKLVELGRQIEEKLKTEDLFRKIFRSSWWEKFGFGSKVLSFYQSSLSNLVQNSGLKKELMELVLSGLRIFSPYFKESDSAFSSALLFRFLLSASQAEASTEDSELSILEIISANGRLIEEEPEAMMVDGKRIASLSFSLKKEISAEWFFISPRKSFELLIEKDKETRRAKELAGRFPRASLYLHSYFFKASSWPEPMAERALWIEPKRKEIKEWLLVSSPLSENLKELSVSYFRRGESKPLEDEEIFQVLKGLFPWLNQRLERKAEPVISHQYLKFAPSQLTHPELKTSFLNLLLLPSELAPFFGLSGIFKLAEVLAGEPSS